MKIQIDSISDVKKKISVQIPEERIQSEMEEALNKAQKQAAIPGFRPGKAPRGMLEKKYGKAIEAEVCQDLIRSSMTQAIEENKLDAITVSEMSEPKREIGKGFSYTASIEVRPSIEPKKYTGLSVKGKDEKVKPEDIDGVMKRLLDSHAVLKPNETAKKPAKDDYVSIVVERIDAEGKSLEKETPQEQLHLVGHPQARKELDEAISKMSIDESKEVLLKHDHAHDHHGDHDHHDHSDVNVRVTLKSIKTKVLPEVNDDFAKTVGPFETMDALKKQIQEDLEKEMAERNKVENVKALLVEVLKNNPASLPETLVENELVNLRQEMFQHMMNSGLTQLPKDFSEEKMNSELKPEAERRIHEQLVLSAIAKKENIQVSVEEIQARLEQYAQMMKKPVAEVKAQYANEDRLAGLQFQILAQKTLDFLLKNANIK